MPNTIPFDSLQRESVQELPDAKTNGADADSFWRHVSARGYHLSAWGTREREFQLRDFYRHEYNWLLQSAIAGLVKKVKATSWEITGPPSNGRAHRVRYFQDLLRRADFGQGWGTFLSKVLLDYFRQDGGGYIEIIAPGHPLKAPIAKATGIAYLDSVQTIPTGDPEYPAVYVDRASKKHLMHHARIMQLVDMPDGDQSHPGYGLCALSRAVSIGWREIHMGQYVEAKLDDQPPPGYAVASNINKGMRNAAFEEFRKEQTADGKPAWGRVMWLYSTDPTNPADLKFVTFQQAPENWNFKEYTELDVNAVAACLGTDVQEIWQLTGGNIGSGQQSQVLHQKSQGKAYGDVLTELERRMNDVLPEDLEFQFKRRDAQETLNEAQTAQLWMSAASQWNDATADERRKLLANQVEAVKDAITDASGQLIRLQDADVQPVGELTVDDTSPALPALPAPSTAAPESKEYADSLANLLRDGLDDLKVIALKAIEHTEAAFATDFTDLVQGGLENEVTRRRAGTVLRGQIVRFGRQAYRDGLIAGGVNTPLTNDDQAKVTALLGKTSEYVTHFLNEVYMEGLTPAELTARAQMWINKTLYAFHVEGLTTADADGMYEFAGTDGVKTCKTCARLQGRRMSLKDWRRLNLVPSVNGDSFECKGFNCRHYLEKVVE